MIPALVAIATTQVAQVKHTFMYVSDKPLTKVNLAGTFNAWNKSADAMTSKDGLAWTKTLSLKPGNYQYKFVLNDETWMPDPKAKSFDDGNGNTNSQLLILPADFSQPAKTGDGKITESVLGHSTKVPDFNFDRGRLTITMTARPGDVQKIFVERNSQQFPMQLVGKDEVAARYRANIPWDRKTDFTYDFLLQDGKRDFYFGPKGLALYRKGNQYTVNAKTYVPFVVPNWVEKSVLYQIFPDRFADGDKSNDPKDVQAWDAKPNYYNRFGGDVAGIEQHLPYLKSLGVGAIYFNPIFSSPSNHRYQAIDYYKVDPQFGTNDEFIRLTNELKKLGIRTILDGVFNHTSTQFFAFNDVVKNGVKSEFKDWYTFHSFPVNTDKPNYDCWWGSSSMPKLHILDSDAENYFLKIPEYWQKHAAIAGWRLDVANEVPMPYWRAFRHTVKTQDPNAWICGEEWGDASAWLGGDQWDATMNYQFREAVLQLVGKGRSGKPSVFMSRLMNTYGSYAPQVSLNLMNLIGSHDTPRILSECGGDKDLAKLAAIAQFTWIGAPCVYYGDELGMFGEKDPDNRRGMTWQAANSENSFLALYKKLIALRKSSAILQSGDPAPVAVDDARGTVVYSRTLNGQSAYIALNRSTQGQSISIPISPNSKLETRNSKLEDALTGQPQTAQNGFIHLSLRARGAAILMPLQGNSPSNRLKSRLRSTSKGPRPSMQVHRSTK